MRASSRIYPGLLEFYCNWCRVGFVVCVDLAQLPDIELLVRAWFTIRLLSYVFINLIYPLAEAPCVVFLFNRSYCEFDFNPP